MSAQPFSKYLRADIIRRATEADADYNRIRTEEYAKSSGAPDKARIRAARDVVQQTSQLYEQGLPRVRMSTCPFCVQPFEHSFDPFGVDGAWWTGLHGPAVPACPHYCFLRGAVHFGNGPAPRGPHRGSAFPGPEVPYVIPKQLQLPGIVAVIGELDMEPGWRAFPICYFADPRPAAEALTYDWTLTSYSYVRSTGEPEMSYPNDPWDFELEPWVFQGKVLWCVPGSNNARLAKPRGPCPYLGLPGIRESIEIGEQIGFKTRGTPDGTMRNPFE